MDAAYLQQAVGPQLTQALTALLIQQPPDAIHFLGQYLLQYVKHIEDTNLQAQRLAKLEASLNTDAPHNDHPDDDDTQPISHLSAQDQISEAELLDAVLDGTKATAAYIAVKDQEELICFVTGEVKGYSLKAGDDQGVLFDLFQPRDTYQTELDQVQAEIEAIPSDADTELAAAYAKLAAVPQYPELIHIDNILREPRIKFFDLPFIGSFAAAPIRYHSHLEQRLVHKALCVHTMRQSRRFTPTQLESLKGWATSFAEISRARESRLFEASSTFRTTVYDAEHIAQAIDAHKDESEAQLDSIDAQDDLRDEQKVVAKQKVRAQAAQALLQATVLEPLSQLAQHDAIAPPKAALQIAIAAILACDTQASSSTFLYPGNPDKPDWPAIAPALQTTICTHIASTQLLDRFASDVHQTAHVATIKLLVSDSGGPSAFAEYYAAPLFAKLHYCLEQLLLLWDHAKAVADAEIEAAAAQNDQ